MKKILFLIIISTLTYNCKAQILPVEDVIDYIRQGEGIPANTTYIKDVNNLFDEFIGVWEVSYDNKIYEFHIVSHTNSIDEDTIEDVLLIRHKITDSNGTVLENTTGLLNGDISIISGKYFLEGGQSYNAQYFRPNSKCGQFGDVIITIDNTALAGNKMKFIFSPGHTIVDPNDCPNDAVYPFPRDTTLVFTKQ